MTPTATAPWFGPAANIPVDPEPPRYRKPLDTGKRVLDIRCFCGKLCDVSLEQYRQHVRAKHPKVHRQMKKAGQWAQLELEWPRRGNAWRRTRRTTSPA